MWNHRAIKRGPHLVQFPFPHEKNMTSKPQPKKTKISPSCEADPNHPSHTWRGSWWIHMGHWIWVILLKILIILPAQNTGNRCHFQATNSLKTPSYWVWVKTTQKSLWICIPKNDGDCMWLLGVNPFWCIFGAMFSGFMFASSQILMMCSEIFIPYSAGEFPQENTCCSWKSKWLEVKFSATAPAALRYGFVSFKTAKQMGWVSMLQKKHWKHGVNTW